MSDLPFSPAADRNKDAILDPLRTLLPPQGTLLEVASGTGQHVVWFAAALPQWTWQPTEAASDALPALAARVAQAGLSNVRAPVQLDVLMPEWGLGRFDAIYCANMLHIAPWSTCAALMQGAARHLAPAGQLITYGPYLEDDVPTAPGNLAFDQSLRERDAAWGLRRREDVQAEAARAGLHLRHRLAMPANNLLLVFTLG
ncbi:MAG: DUF938 domain-containing protein [Ramlibacter sp.]|nr:DUF938 domain-containing protein [Ramlibacter sp.]